MRPGVIAVMPGLFSLEEQPGTVLPAGDDASPQAARWPQPWDGEGLDDPTADWLKPGKGAAELAGTEP